MDLDQQVADAARQLTRPPSETQKQLEAARRYLLKPGPSGDAALDAGRRVLLGQPAPDPGGR